MHGPYAAIVGPREPFDRQPRVLARLDDPELLCKLTQRGVEDSAFALALHVHRREEGQPRKVIRHEKVERESSSDGWTPPIRLARIAARKQVIASSSDRSAEVNRQPQSGKRRDREFGQRRDHRSL
jgi:hypothetical protein